MIKKLTPISWVVVICLSGFLVLRTTSALNSKPEHHNLIAIVGLAMMVVGTLLGGGRSYKSDPVASRTKADLALVFGFLALISSYALKYLGR